MTAQKKPAVPDVAARKGPARAAAPVPPKSAPPKPVPRKTAPRKTVPPKPVPFRVVGLDGLRALAVALVILYHLAPPAVMPGGFLGVDIFFVVSGFLITSLLLREKADTGRIALGAFWRRRARRLLPALGLLLITCCTAALAVGGDVLVRLSTQVLGAITFSSNWLFIAGGSSYFDESTPELFRNLWSLAVEEQFYLLWPLLVAFALLRLPRRARLAAVGAAALASAVAMALLWDPVDATRVYYGTDTHAFGLALGAVLALLAQTWSPRPLEWARWQRRALGVGGPVAVVLLVAAAALLPADSPLAYRGGLAAVAVLSAVAIAALLVPGSPLGRVLELAPLRWIGRRSYGLYLWHWPVFVLVAAALPTWSRDGGEGWTLGLIALALTVGAATLSYALVEEPIRRRGFRASGRAFVAWWRSSRHTLIAGTWITALALLATTGTFGALASDPGRGETEALVAAGQQAIDAANDAAEQAAAEAEADAAAGGGDEGGPAPTSTPQAVGGEQIVAIGDSVMLAAAPTLQADYPGIAIDAQVSRSMYVAPDMVQALADAGQLRQVLVLALGTNGPIERDTLERIRGILGPTRQLVVVNVQAPRYWTDGVNQTLSAFAVYYRDVELANWHDAIQPSLDVLAGDQIHFGSSGAVIFSSSIRAALQRLAELPPLRDERADESLPRPV